MAALTPRVGGDGLALFRATDAFAVEAYRSASAMTRTSAEALAREIRRTAVLCGGAAVAAASRAPDEPGHRQDLQRARAALVEGRYYLYLARRFGLMDGRSYRALTLRQDAALREVDNYLRPDAAPERAPPSGR